MVSNCVPFTEDNKPDDADTDKVSPSTGIKTILIADDDSQARNIVKLILSKSGYTVLEAEDGDVAVRIFSKHPDEINLVILDIVMPRKNGMDAYNEIKKLKNDVKAIFISGYTADVIDHNGAVMEDIKIMAKPISPNNLLLKIKEVLTS